MGARFDELTFGWDNEFSSAMVFVPRFAIGGTPVTNAEFLAFVEDGGYRTREWWASEDWRWRVRAAAMRDQLIGPIGALYIGVTAGH